MNKKLILLALLTVSLSLYSQEQQRRVQISINSGRFMAGSEETYTNIHLGWNLGMDVRFFLTERFFLTAHLNHGENSYFEDSWRTNAPKPAEGGTWWIGENGPFNATLRINHVGLLAGYYLPVTQWMNLRGQAGISQIIEVRDAFPVKIYQPNPNMSNITRHDSAFFSIAFPVKFDIGFTPFERFRNIEIGLTAGFYIAPDWGFFTGRYISPQIAISF